MSPARARRQWTLCASLAALLGALLWSPGAPAAHAQDGGLRVGLIRPMEGETYYAGPTSVVYSIKIEGWVAGAADPRAVRVRIDILQGAQVHGTVAVVPDADGTFAVSATVNPDGAHGDFGPVEIVTRCEECHYRAEIDLPNGAILLRLSATAPGGQEARMERRIVVDRSTLVSVPVKVVNAAQPEQRIEGLPVSASTRLYLWRARHASAATGADGIAHVAVEAPTQSPARYVFRVEPAVLNGVLYAGTQSVEVSLPPGASGASPITLTVSARKGRLTGSVSPRAASPLAVRAIHLPDGVSHAASVSADGTFAFEEMAIGAYVVALDAPALADNGWVSEARSIDLAEEPATPLELALTRAGGRAQRGTVRDETGATLPFAWLSADGEDTPARSAPDTGAFAMRGSASTARALVASAPGYYSQAHAGAAEALSIALTPRPDTRRIAWGEGTVVVPAETDVSLSGGQFTLAQGWLWGQGGTAPLLIGTHGAQITMQNGTFALEQLPASTGWLMVMEGEAVVTFERTRERVRVTARQMIALTDEPAHPAIPFNALVLEQLRPQREPPYSLVWEPSLGARLRDGLAHLGISAAQAVTFVTYSVVVLSLALIPAFGLRWWRRQQPGARK